MAANPPSLRPGVEQPAGGMPVAGSVLGGKFRVVQQLGQGGMGVVFEVEHTISGKRLAAKWMQPDLGDRPQAVERFLREARACARVRHPNVVDVYDVVHEGNVVFLVMELLEGEPLSAALACGGMPAHELIALLIEAMRGVAAAHRQGVIHRDIKPDNIFLSREADRATLIPKVLDFGISKVADGAGMSLTQTGVMIGTPMYMSLEQLQGVRDIDARTDIYAFGVILYEALTGRPPYTAGTLTELIFSIAHTDPISPKTLCPDIPSPLERVVMCAMAKDRNKRFAALDQMIQALAPFSTGAGFRARMTGEHGELPRVVASALQLAPTATDTATAETPAPEAEQEAEIDIASAQAGPHTSPAPQRPRALWLVRSAGGIAVLALTGFFGWSRLAVVAPPAVAPPASQPLPPASTATATVATPAAKPDIMGSSETPGTVPSPTPPSTTGQVIAADHAPAALAPTQRVDSDAPTTSEKRTAKQVSSEHPLGRADSTRASRPMPRSKTSLPAGTTPARPVANTRPNAPATAADAAERGNGLRAGRPHAEDF